MSEREQAALVVDVADSVSFGEVMGIRNSSSSSSQALAGPELQQLETVLNIDTTLVAMHICARPGQDGCLWRHTAGKAEQ